MNNYLSRNKHTLITSLQLLMITEIKWPRYMHFIGFILGLKRTITSPLLETFSLSSRVCDFLRNYG